MEDPLLKEDDPINTADTTSLISGNDHDNDGVGIDGVPRQLEQDELTSDSNETRPKRYGIPTLAFVVVPMVIFLAGTFLAAAFLPRSTNPPTENKDDDNDNGPPSSMSSNSSQNNNSKSENNIMASSDNNIVAAPTLLAMRDNKDGGDMLNVHDHQLYTQIKDASTFHYHAQHSDFLMSIAKHGAKSLEPDKYEVDYGDSLTLAWSPREGDVDDEDIIAMYCPSFEVDPKNFRDVATLAQVKATRAIHAAAKSVEMADNVWNIPSFPTVREDSCEFRLYSHSVDDASNQGNEGSDNLEQEEQQKEQHHYTFMATTGPISLTSNIVPTGIHIGLTGEANEVIIQFVTGHAGEPLVEYSEKSDVRNSIELEQVQELSMAAPMVSTTKVKGESTTYVAADMCEAPATSTDPGFFISPGYLHKVKVGNLKAGVEYNYKVGLGFGQGVKWSDQYVLHGPTPRGATSSEEGKPASTFLVLANQGCGESKYDTVLGADPPTSPAAISSHNNPAQDVADLISSLVDDDAQTIDSVHHLGNLAYADGAAHVWDAYTNMIQSYASRVPILVGVGNHDYDHSGGGGGDRKDISGVINMFNPPWGNGAFATTGGECGVPVSKRFAVPEGGNGVFWYSYDQSLVHTVMLSSEHNMTIGSSQYVWLENDLAKVNRSITPWLVVEMHRPMYSELDRFLLCVFDAQTLFFLHSNKNHPTVSLHPNRQRTGKLAKSHGL